VPCHQRGDSLVCQPLDRTLMGKSSVSLRRRTMNGRLLAVGDVAEVSEWALASKRGCKVSRVVVASERLRCLPHRVLSAAARGAPRPQAYLRAGLHRRPAAGDYRRSKITPAMPWFGPNRPLTIKRKIGLAVDDDEHAALARRRLDLLHRLVDPLARYLTSATSSGRTQWTRLNVSGDPKRLPRSDGANHGFMLGRRRR